MVNRIANIVGIYLGTIGVVTGLVAGWHAWCWLSLFGVICCLIAMPSVWRRRQL